MGCPDKKRDQVIIAEVEKRKVARVEPKQTTWEGSLISLLTSGISEEEIVNIARISDGWIIDLKE